MPPDGPGPSASSSGLDFQLHPLVLINISDHHTRSKANAAPGAPPIRVAGCLLGQQAGRTVDISNSFEVNIVPGEPALLDAAFLAKKLDQYKQTFPALDLVGWYSTGAAPSPDDLASHRQLLALNDAPVFLQLDPAPPPAATRDLPVALYESEMRAAAAAAGAAAGPSAAAAAASLTFTPSPYVIATSEAERIGVDQVSKTLPAASAAGAAQLSAHLGSMHSATGMLVERVAALRSLLARMQSGELPLDPRLARQAAALVSRLPAADPDRFAEESAAEACDAVLPALLAALTRGSAAAHELVDKHNLAYERLGSAKRAGKAGAGFSLGGLL